MLQNLTGPANVGQIFKRFWNDFGSVAQVREMFGAQMLGRLQSSSTIHVNTSHESNLSQDRLALETATMSGHFHSARRLDPTHSKRDMPEMKTLIEASKSIRIV